MKRASGTWWRFSRYELRDGYICPAPGAALEQIDPWSAYWRREGHVSFPPHLDLADVVRHVPTAKGLSAPVPESEELQTEVLRWCKQNGLLGLLPHTVLSVRLRDWRATRTANGWTNEREAWVPEQFGPPEEEIVTDMFGDGQRPDSVEANWHQYFPTMYYHHAPASNFHILPETEEFWKQYGEPFDYFVQVALFFTNAVRVLADSGDEIIDEGSDEPLDRAGARTRLNDLMNGVTPSVAVDKRGRNVESWRSPSLLGHLARQAVDELLGDRRVIICRDCERIFASSHWHAEYCSDRCATRNRVRRHREKKRTQKEGT